MACRGRSISARAKIPSHLKREIIYREVSLLNLATLGHKNVAFLERECRVVHHSNCLRLRVLKRSVEYTDMLAEAQNCSQKKNYSHLHTGTKTL